MCYFFKKLYSNSICHFAMPVLAYLYYVYRLFKIYNCDYKQRYSLLRVQLRSLLTTLTDIFMINVNEKNKNPFESIPLKPATLTCGVKQQDKINTNFKITSYIIFVVFTFPRLSETCCFVTAFVFMTFFKRIMSRILSLLVCRNIRGFT